MRNRFLGQEEGGFNINVKDFIPNFLCALRDIENKYVMLPTKTNVNPLFIQ